MSDKSGDDIRREVTEEISQAHAVAAVYVTFPRDDNDLEQIDAVSTQFAVDGITMTEELAADKVVTDSLSEMADQDRAGDLTSMGAMPVPDGLQDQLEAMMAQAASDEDDEDEDDDGAETKGFQ